MKTYINIILMIIVDIFQLVININLFAISVIFIFVPILFAFKDALTKKRDLKSALTFHYDNWGRTLHGNMLVDNQFRE
jgi:hypothetical protein